MKYEYTISDLENIASEFLKIVLDYKKSLGEKSLVVGLSGNLGAGKTTLMQYVARALSVEGNIISPTFVLRRDYKLNGGIFESLIHIDAYRLEKKENLFQVILQSELEKGNNLVVVEWPEMVDEKVFDLIFLLEHKSETERKIELVYRR